MASPHTAGAAALVLASNPNATPSQVFQSLVNNGVTGRLSGIGTGSPNVLLQVAADDGTPPVDQAPTAAFSSDCTLLDCSFNAAGSSDDNGIVQYQWAFGDSASDTGAAVFHSYNTAGTYTVSLTVTDNASQSDSLSQQVTVTEQSTCTGCDNYTGTLSGNGDEDILPNTNGFSSNGGTFTATLTGPANADFDLHLQKKTQSLFFSGWQNVSSATSNSSNESINYSGSAGTYRWSVESYSGSGNYQLETEAP
jgi:serine protease